MKKCGFNRIVVAGCSPRLYEPVFQCCVSQAGLNPFLFEMANIREFSSWRRPNTPKETMEKAKELVKMAVAKVKLLESLDVIDVPVTDKALVVGAGVAGASTALDLAEIVKEITAQMSVLGKDRIKTENEKLKPILDKTLKRKK